MGTCKLPLVAALLLVAFLAQNVAAWNAANNCTDEIVGYSPWFGVQGESKPMRVQNHTLEWREFGPITKVNLYYSWNFGCLQGIKATYGYKARNARMVGHQHNLYTTHLKLGAFEDINRIDLRQEPNKCINYIKLYTNKGRAMGFGNSASTAPLISTRPPVSGGVLAFLKGWEDLVPATNSTGSANLVAGGLQSLQFVWAAEYCPNATVTTPPPQAPVPVLLIPLQGPPEPPQAPPPLPPPPVVMPPPPAPEPPSPPPPPAPVTFTPTAGPDTEAPEVPPPAPPPPPPPPAVPDTPPDVPDDVEDDTPAPPPPMEIPQEIPDSPVQPIMMVPPQAPMVMQPAPQPMYMPAPVFPQMPIYTPAAPVLRMDTQPLCPIQPRMCDAGAQRGQAGYCPFTNPFSAPQCEGGCCISSGKCRQPLCRLNGLGEDVAALDFICFGSNRGPFGRYNKCRGLRCMLTVPGCRSDLGGNCVGYVAVDTSIPQVEAVLDPHAVRFLGRPCIEMAATPHVPSLPSLPSINININFRKSAHVSLQPVSDESASSGYGSGGGSSFGGGAGGNDVNRSHLDSDSSQTSDDMFAQGLWTVCDCTATNKHPVLPAIPLFGLKKGLLGSTHPLFAGLMAGRAAADALTTGNSNAGGAAAVGGLGGGGACRGPVCALLPMLSAMNLTLADVQVPMTMLANLTALLHPQPLSLPPMEGLIPQVQLPEINITIDTPITRPELPTFADCAKYLIEFAKALQPVVTDIVPQMRAQPAQTQMHSLAKIASTVLASLRAQGSPQQADATQPLPRFNVGEIVDTITKLAPMITRGPDYDIRLNVDKKMPSGGVMAATGQQQQQSYADDGGIIDSNLGSMSSAVGSGGSQNTNNGVGNTMIYGGSTNAGGSFNQEQGSVRNAPQNGAARGNGWLRNRLARSVANRARGASTTTSGSAGSNGILGNMQQAVQSSRGGLPPLTSTVAISNGNNGIGLDNIAGSISSNDIVPASLGGIGVQSAKSSKSSSSKSTKSRSSSKSRAVAAQPTAPAPTPAIASTIGYADQEQWLQKHPRAKATAAKSVDDDEDDLNSLDYDMNAARPVKIASSAAAGDNRVQSSSKQHVPRSNQAVKATLSSQPTQTPPVGSSVGVRQQRAQAAAAAAAGGVGQHSSTVAGKKTLKPLPSFAPPPAAAAAPVVAQLASYADAGADVAEEVEDAASDAISGLHMDSAAAAQLPALPLLNDTDSTSAELLVADPTSQESDTPESNTGSGSDTVAAAGSSEQQGVSDDITAAAAEDEAAAAAEEEATAVTEAAAEEGTEGVIESVPMTEAEQQPSAVVTPQIVAAGAAAAAAEGDSGAAAVTYAAEGDAVVEEDSTAVEDADTIAAGSAPSTGAAPENAASLMAPYGGAAVDEMDEQQDGEYAAADTNLSGTAAAAGEGSASALPAMSPPPAAAAAAVANAPFMESSSNQSGLVQDVVERAAPGAGLQQQEGTPAAVLANAAPTAAAAAAAPAQAAGDGVGVDGDGTTMLSAPATPAAAGTSSDLTPEDSVADNMSAAQQINTAVSSAGAGAGAAQQNGTPAVGAAVDSSASINSSNSSSSSHSAFKAESALQQAAATNGSTADEQSAAVVTDDSDEYDETSSVAVKGVFEDAGAPAAEAALPPLPTGTADAASAYGTVTAPPPPAAAAAAQQGAAYRGATDDDDADYPDASATDFDGPAVVEDAFAAADRQLEGGNNNLGGTTSATADAADADADGSFNYNYYGGVAAGSPQAGAAFAAPAAPVAPGLQAATPAGPVPAPPGLIYDSPDYSGYE